MARISGHRGQVRMDPTGGSSVVTVASLSDWSLDIGRERHDVSAFGDPNKIRVNGLPDYSGTVGGFWDATTTPTAFFDVVLGDVAPFLHLIPDSAAPTFLFKGLANLDGGIKVSANGAVSISGAWDAAGPWVMEP